MHTHTHSLYPQATQVVGESVLGTDSTIQLLMNYRINNIHASAVLAQ